MTAIAPLTPSATQPTRLMLVDDHASFRASARWLLETEGYEIVAEAGSGESALDQLVAASPDVVLLDVGLPGIDGFRAAQAICARLPRARVVLTSSRDFADLGAERVHGCGAVGFVPKTELSRAALDALIA